MGEVDLLEIDARNIYMGKPEFGFKHVSFVIRNLAHGLVLKVS